MEEVWIHWRGHYRLELCAGREASYDWGIYAISRYWGDNGTLLYIGQSYRQLMLDRISCHEKYWLHQYRGEMYVQFGTIELEEGLKHSQRRTNHIEALMIYSQQPLHNIQHKQYYAGRDLLIWNNGRYGLLDARVCSDDYC